MADVGIAIFAPRTSNARDTAGAEALSATGELVASSGQLEAGGAGQDATDIAGNAQGAGQLRDAFDRQTPSVQIASAGGDAAACRNDSAGATEFVNRFLQELGFKPGSREFADAQAVFDKFAGGSAAKLADCNHTSADGVIVARDDSHALRDAMTSTAAYYQRPVAVSQPTVDGQRVELFVPQGTTPQPTGAANEDGVYKLSATVNQPRPDDGTVQHIVGAGFQKAATIAGSVAQQTLDGVIDAVSKTAGQVTTAVGDGIAETRANVERTIGESAQYGRALTGQPYTGTTSGGDLFYKAGELQLKLTGAAFALSPNAAYSILGPAAAGALSANGHGENATESFAENVAAGTLLHGLTLGAPPPKLGGTPRVDLSAYDGRTIDVPAVSGSGPFGLGQGIVPAGHPANERALSILNDAHATWDVLGKPMFAMLGGPPGIATAFPGDGNVQRGREYTTTRGDDAVDYVKRNPGATLHVRLFDVPGQVPMASGEIYSDRSGNAFFRSQPDGEVLPVAGGLAELPFGDPVAEVRLSLDPLTADWPGGALASRPLGTVAEKDRGHLGLARQDGFSQTSEADRVLSSAMVRDTAVAAKDIRSGAIRSFDDLWRSAKTSRVFVAQSRDEPIEKIRDLMTTRTQFSITPLTGRYEYMAPRVAELFPESHPNAQFPAISMHGGQIFGEIDGERIPLTRLSYPGDVSASQMADLKAYDRGLRDRFVSSDTTPSERNDVMQNLADNGVGMIHTTPEQLPKIMSHVETLYQHALDPTVSDSEFVDTVAEMHWWISQASPDNRGTPTKMDFAAYALFQARGLNPPPWKPGVVPDLEAIFSNKDAFVQNYRSMFERDPLTGRPN